MKEGSTKKDSEAKRQLTRAGFTVVRSTNTHDVYEFDDEIQVAVSRRNVENPHTTRAVEQALRRAEQRKATHESRQMEQKVGVKFEKNPPWVKEPFRATFKDVASASKLAMSKPPKGVEVMPTPAKPPEPTPVVEEKKKREIHKFTREDRYPLWRKIAVLHEVEGLGWPDLARRLDADGIKMPSGEAMTPVYVNASYKAYTQMVDMLRVPKADLEAAVAKVQQRLGAVAGAPAEPQNLTAALPDYMRSLFLDENMPAAKKIAVLRALHSEIPASIELLMDDGGLSSSQKLQILAICLQPKET